MAVTLRCNRLLVASRDVEQAVRGRQRDFDLRAAARAAVRGLWELWKPLLYQYQAPENAKCSKVRGQSSFESAWGLPRETRQTRRRAAARHAWVAFEKCLVLPCRPRQTRRRPKGHTCKATMASMLESAAPAVPSLALPTQPATDAVDAAFQRAAAERHARATASRARIQPR